MEDIKESKILSAVIRAAEGIITADGRVDMVETGILLKILHALDDGPGGDFRAFVSVLREVREDGVVSSAESERIRQLIAALADRSEPYKIIRCPECNRPLSSRTTDIGEVECPWCGRKVTFIKENP